jgi:hypothetical protein
VSDSEPEIESPADGESGADSDFEVIDEEPIGPLDTTNPDPIATAQRRYGGAGAVIAAGMFGLEMAMGIKPKPESVQIQEAPTDPIDVDRDGISVKVDDTVTVHAPALDRHAPIGVGKRRSRRG